MPSPFDSPLIFGFRPVERLRADERQPHPPNFPESHPRSKKRGFRRLWILTPSLLAMDHPGGQHGAMQPYPSPEAAELVKLSPAKRQARFYRLEIWPDLFGGFSLAREYGRIGQPGRLQLDPFPEIDTPAKRLPASSKGSGNGGMSLVCSGSGIRQCFSDRFCG